MLSKDELVKIMIQEGIRCYEVEIDLKAFDKTALVLDSGDINELIGFIKSNEIRNVFFTNSFYDEDIFNIDEEMVAKLPEEVKLQIEDEVKEHNDSVMKVDFTRPIGMYIFCLYQSRYISISQYDFWETDLGLITGEVKIAQLIAAKQPIIEQKIESRKKEEEKLKEEFKNFVLTDEAFRMCTNDRFRRDYMCKVFERKETQKYKHLFYDGDHLEYGIAINFIELLWREYKARLGQ